MKDSSGVISALAISLMLLTTLFSTAHAADPFPTGITLYTREKLYAPGETIQVIGHIHSYVPGVNTALINVYTPDNQMYLSNKPLVEGTILQFTFLLDSNAKTGDWRVLVRYPGIEADTTFTVVNNGLDKAIASKPVLLNNMGNVLLQDEQKAGKTVAIAADLENDEDVQQKYVFIVQVFDSSGSPVLTTFALGSMDPLQKVKPSVNWLPGTSGSYTVNVMVWSSLSNPVALTEKQAAVFVIV